MGCHVGVGCLEEGINMVKLKIFISSVQKELAEDARAMADFEAKVEDEFNKMIEKIKEQG